MLRRTSVAALILVIMANANVVTPHTLADQAKPPVKIQPVQINLENPTALEYQKPDFTAEFVIPAREQLAQANRIKAQSVAKRLAQAGLSDVFALQYVEAANRTGTPWQLIAAVHKIESGQRGNTTVASSAGAQGPMQFLPSTFRAYAIDGDGDGRAVIYDVDDAIVTAANYLRAGGASNGNYTKALLTYNHSMAYANRVLGIAVHLGLN